MKDRHMEVAWVFMVTRGPCVYRCLGYRARLDTHESWPAQTLFSIRRRWQYDDGGVGGCEQTALTDSVYQWRNSHPRTEIQRWLSPAVFLCLALLSASLPWFSLSLSLSQVGRWLDFKGKKRRERKKKRPQQQQPKQTEAGECVTKLVIRLGVCHRSRGWGGSAGAYFFHSSGRASTRSCSAAEGPSVAAVLASRATFPRSQPSQKFPFFNPRRVPEGSGSFQRRVSPFGFRVRRKSLPPKAGLCARTIAFTVWRG